MTREILVAAIQRAVVESKYSPYAGFEYRINSELKRVPAVWVLPPKMVKQEGRKQGIKHYEVEMNIIAKCKSQEQAAKEQQWGAMEQDAAKIIGLMEEESSVKAITNVSCQPGEFTLTNRAELSLKVNFRVELPFCNK